MISPEELGELEKMADRYLNPPSPRIGSQTVRLYEEIEERVMRNLAGLLAAARAADRFREILTDLSELHDGDDPVGYVRETAKAALAVQ